MTLFATFTDILAVYWPYIAVFVVVAVLSGVTLGMLSKARTDAAQTLDRLLVTNVDVYLERLTSNKRLKWVFRKSIIQFMLLKGYIVKGDDDKALQCIRALDSMRLEPQEKVEFLQTRISFFATRNNREEALAGRDSLVNFLKKVKADKTDKYREILEEADMIIKVYVEKDVNFIPSLIAKAAKTAHPVVRGITQYRIAKLAYFKQDEQLVTRYLQRAAKNLKGTSYQQIVESALKDSSVLAEQ